MISKKQLIFILSIGFLGLLMIFPFKNNNNKKTNYYEFEHITRNFKESEIFYLNNGNEKFLKNQIDINSNFYKSRLNKLKKQKESNKNKVKLKNVFIKKVTNEKNNIFNIIVCFRIEYLKENLTSETKDEYINYDIKEDRQKYIFLNEKVISQS